MKLRKTRTLLILMAYLGTVFVGILGPLAKPVQAAKIDVAFTYDNSTSSLNKKDKAASGFDDLDGDNRDGSKSIWGDSKVLVKGGIFGDGATFSYADLQTEMKTGSKNASQAAPGFRYVYDYACKDDASGYLYRIELSAILDLRGKDPEDNQANSSDNFNNRSSYPFNSDIGNTKKNTYGIVLTKVIKKKEVGNNQSSSPDKSIRNDTGLDVSNDGKIDHPDEGDEGGTEDSMTIPPACLGAYQDARTAGAMVNLPKASDATKASWGAAGKAATNNSPDGSGGTDDGVDGDNCSGVFGWAICQLLRESEKAVGWVEDNFIVPFYTTDPLRLDCGSMSASQRASTEGCAEYNVWVAIRNLSNIFFVLIFLAFIFANTLSFNLDSYAVKKMLPKLIAAVIIVQFSYLFMAFAIDITNVLGRGIGGIVNSAIPDNLQFNVGVDQAAVGLGISAAVGGAVAVGLATAFASGSVWVIVALAFIAIIGVFFTLIFRQMLIVMLVISAPIAIACLVLPNTEKVYKLWLNTLIKVLLMYPLIMLIFSSSKLLSLAAAINGGAFASVIRLVVTVLPLFLIPFTFKWAGGLMNAGATVIQKRSAGYGKKVNDSEWAKERRTQAGIEKRSLAAGTGISIMGHNRGSGGVGRFLGRATTLDRGGVRAQSKLNTDRGVYDKQFEAGNHSADDLEMLLGGKDELKRRKNSADAALNAKGTTATDDDRLKHSRAVAAAEASYQKTKGLQGNKVAMQAAALRIAGMGMVSERTRTALSTAMPGEAGQALWGEMGRKAGDKQLHLQAVNFNTGAVEISKLKSKVDGKDAKKLAGQGADFWRTVRTAENQNGTGAVLDPTVGSQLTGTGPGPKLSTESASILYGGAANTNRWGGEASNPEIKVV